MNKCSRMLVATRSLLAALVLLAAAAAHGQTIVERVEVVGNQRIEPETVVSYMTVAVGDAYDLREVDASLKSLFATGLFADVRIRLQGSALVVEVVENPIVNRIAFEGNAALQTEDLETEVQLRPRTVYTRTRVQSDIARILELYRRDGRFNASVEPKVILREQNRVDVVFEIDEGAATAVREVAFIGNRAFSDGTLREAIATVETAWYRFFTANDNYDPDRLAFDRELLRRHYLSEGFADFRVLSALAELTPDRRQFFITFTVEEGPRYSLARVSVASDFAGIAPADVEDLVTVSPGDVFDADEVDEVAREIALELGRRGFAFVDVQPVVERDRAQAAIDLEYRIVRGEPLYVERIEIIGNLDTADEVIRREFRLAEGDAFNPALLQRSERRIRALDFFNAVEVRVAPGTAPGRVIVTVEVEERPTGELSIGAGFSTFDNAIFNIGVRERNLLGKGQRLSLDLALSGRRQTVDLSFVEPYFLDRELEAGIDVFRRRLDLQDESSFTQEDVGGAVSLSHPLTEHLRQTFSYTLQSVAIEDVRAGASRYIREQSGTSVTSAVGERLDYDRRDDVFNPTSGYQLRHSVDVAGLGGSQRYIRNKASASFYYPFAIDWVGSVIAEAGMIEGLGGKDVSISDRFFLGGRSLRGFEPAGIGPRDLATGDSLGGKRFWSATASLTVPLGLPRELGLLGRVFSDWGSLFDLDRTGPGVADESAPRGSVGIGLSYNSPIGPLRLDFSRAVRKEAFDRTEVFRFSFGTAF